jgi:putative nucleotidyltransferase with HDIG domain
MVNKQAKILIVDELTVSKLLHQQLSKEGYQCDTANSADEVWAKLKKDPPELVIADIRMSGKTGLEMLSEIKVNYPDITVIMATAVNETSIAIRCLKDGADDYICKPFNLDEVSLIVSRSLFKRKLELQIKEYREQLEEKVGEQTAEIRRIFLGSIEALVFALEAKHKYTAGHSQTVTDITTTIGKEIGLCPEDMEDLRWGSLLHDVGKIAIDQLIHNKPGRLTVEEYEHIMTHAHIGAGIVKPMVNEKVVEIIRHHHNHYDGSGLHQTLTGESIPLGARILALADALDAMISARPYRSAISLEKAFDEIKRCSGTQFDPLVVEAFFKANIASGVLEKA